MQTAPKNTQFQEIRSNIEPCEEVLTADAKLREDPSNPDLWMEKGRAFRKQMLVREAIDAYSMGLTINPFHALLYRHRGHSYINIRRYYEGAADLELSSRLDPLNWDTWYHLGLAWHLIGLTAEGSIEDFKRARKAYEKCIEITKTEDDLAAIIDWYWMTLMRLGQKELAAEAAARLTKNAKVVENVKYFKRVLAYNGSMDPEEVITDARGKGDHNFATQAYGIACLYEFRGDMKRCREILEEITKCDELWTGFAETAAYERLKNWK
jgi:tetratricopeptide (TPR) repeat protein